LVTATTQKRKSRRSRDERSKQLIDAALNLFLTKGYAQTSLSDIIEETGGSRRDFYDLFGDKLGLFEAVMQYLISDVLEVSAFPDPDSKNRDVREDLIAMGTGFLHAMLDARFLAAMRQFVAVASEKPDLGFETYEIGPRMLHKKIETYLQQKSDANELDIPDVPNASIALSGMLKGDFQIRALMTGNFAIEPDQIDHHVTQAVDLFLRGALPRPSQAA